MWSRKLVGLPAGVRPIKNDLLDTHSPAQVIYGLPNFVFDASRRFNRFHGTSVWGSHFRIDYRPNRSQLPSRRWSYGIHLPGHTSREDQEHCDLR